MKIVVAIATMEGRQQYLAKTIKSLLAQCDHLRVYKNHQRDVDYTDNAKFYFLQDYKQPVYYLTCDDDIIYPPDYVQRMVDAIDRTGGIVTHHGRILKAKGVSYYRGRHEAYRCTGWVNQEKQIHVGGSGVMGWRTDVFNPVELYKSEHKRMSDIIVSLEAAKQKVPITLITHKAGEILAQPVPNEETIWGQHYRDDTTQSSLADEILSYHRRRPN